MKATLISKLLFALLGVTLAPSCIFVRFRGDLDDLGHLSDVVAEAEPDGEDFRHADPEFDFDFDWSGDVEESLEMEFDCDPSDLTSYFEALQGAVEWRIQREGGLVESFEQHDPFSCSWEFDGDGGAGTVDLSISEQRSHGSYRYRLDLDWEEED